MAHSDVAGSSPSRSDRVSRALEREVGSVLVMLGNGASLCAMLHGLVSPNFGNDSRSQFRHCLDLGQEWSSWRLTTSSSSWRRLR
jgi:hypothetical protein